jgi:O-methyltransferase
MSIDYAARYQAAREAFAARIDRAGLNAEAKHFLWYHTIDCGHALVTPGLFDYRGQWAGFGLPERFDGQTVLDAGPATGFFSFEFARRGARTSCIELPSLRALDRFPGQSLQQSLAKIERMMQSETGGGARTETELYWQMLEGPYRFCQERLGCRVERHYMTVYDAARDVLGAPEGYDWVYAGDILLHLLYPTKALAALASVCRGTLVVVEQCPGAVDDPPALLYRGGSSPEEDEVQWWLMNRACLEQILRKLGFREVREVGRHVAVMQTSGYQVERTVLHATR